MTRSSSLSRCRAVAQAAEGGRTLIELVIAMALSLMIVAAVGSLYYFTSQSSRVSEQLSTAEERGRLALHFVGEPIALAGYGNINSGELSGAGRTQVLSFKGTHLRACSNSRFADPLNNDFTCVPAQNGAPGDQLFIGYQAEASTAAPQGVGGQVMRDCIGQIPVGVTYEVNPVPVVFNVYSVETTANGALEFGCRGGANVARQSLIRDVEDFKVYFALDTQGYLFGEAGLQLRQAVPSALRTAAQINALPGAGDTPDSLGNPWNHVVAVYVCVQLRTTEVGTTPDGVSRYQPCPVDETEAATGTAEISVNDGFARRSYTQVFTIRARTQADTGSQF
jgi:type II secretory pathway pseudopilin PulG